MKVSEMIDKIKPRQKAKTTDWDIVVEKSTFGEIIIIQNGTSNKFVGEPLRLSSVVLNANWKLQPKPIGFSQACELLKQGKSVVLVNGDSLVHIHNFDSVVSIRDIQEGTLYDAEEVSSHEDLEW